MKSRLFTTIWIETYPGRKESEPLIILSKPGLYPEKVMHRINWDWKSIANNEPLLQNQTLKSDKYVSQMDGLNVAIEEKTSGIY